MPSVKIPVFSRLLLTLAVLPVMLRADTALNLTTSVNPVRYGAPVVLFVAVSPSDASGRMTFYDGADVIGTAPVAAGTATFTTSLLPAGSRKLKAYYSGDATHAAAVSNVVTQSVNPLAGDAFLPPTFLTGLPATPSGVATGDFNRDGWVDLAITGGAALPGGSSSNVVSIVFGNGDGTFQTPLSYPVAAGPSGVVASDFNGDSDTDVAVLTAGSVDILTRNFDGSFGPAVHYPVTAGVSLALADFNNDGRADLVVGGSNSSITILPGRGDGTFGPAGVFAADTTGRIAIGDFNGDGNTDIAAASSGGVTLLAGNGNGTFQAPATFAVGATSIQSPGSLLTADFNRDGRADLAGGGTVFNFNSGCNCSLPVAFSWVLLGNGNGTFQPAISLSNANLFVQGDFNGDSIPDLAGASELGGNNGALTVLLGNGDGTFRSTLTLPSFYSSTLAIADFNNDGRADILTGSPADLGAGTFTLSVRAGTPFGALTLTGSGGTFRSALVTTAFASPLQVTVTNNGLPVSGATVRFQSQSSGGAFGSFPDACASGACAPITAINVVTNEAGVATARLKANEVAGTYLVSASYQGQSTFFSVTNETVNITPAAGVLQTTAPGTPFASPLQVQVRDPRGNPAGGVTLTFSAPASGASAFVSPQQVVTDGSGFASTTATANSISGSYNVSATVGGAAGLFFLTNGSAGTGTMNLAQGRAASQSSTLVGYGLGGPAAAVDGNTAGSFFGGSVTHTNLEASPWWQVDLGTSASMSSIVIWNRTDCCGERLGDYWVFVSDTPFSPNDTPAALQNRAGTWSTHQTTAPNPAATVMPGGAQGRYVRVQLGSPNNLSLAEVQVFGTWTTIGANLTPGKIASQSSTLPDYATTGAASAIDGNTNGNFFSGSVTHTNLEANPWWQVDLGASATVSSIVIWNRTDCCGDRLADYWVFASDTPFGPGDTPAALAGRAGTWSSHQTGAPGPSTTIAVPSAAGRYVRVQLAGTNNLSLAEVQVFGVFTSTNANLAPGKTATQSTTLQGYSTGGAGAAADGGTGGDFFGGSVTHTEFEINPWWQIDLGSSVSVNSIAIWNRTDCCGDRLGDYWVFVSDTPFSATDTPEILAARAGTWSNHQTSAPNASTSISVGARGRYVRVQLAGANALSLAEVQIFGQ